MVWRLARQIIDAVAEQRHYPTNSLKNKKIVKAAQESKNQFDIYLESGSIINTEFWWEENNMIMYKKHGGSMGIEKTRVKKIVKR